MDLKQVILEPQTIALRNRIVSYIGVDKKRFALLMQLFFSGDSRISQRAAWCMSYCVQGHPGLITPYRGRLISNLCRDGLPDAVLRNSLRLLQYVPVPARHHGKLMDRCFHYVLSPRTAVAIKAFSLTLLQRLAVEYPEIQPELILAIEECWPHESAAFHSRARKILKGQVPPAITKAAGGPR